MIWNWAAVADFGTGMIGMTEAIGERLVPEIFTVVSNRNLPPALFSKLGSLSPPVKYAVQASPPFSAEA